MAHAPPFACCSLMNRRTVSTSSQKSQIYGLIRSLTEKGLGVLMVSSEIEELGGSNATANFGPAQRQLRNGDLGA